MRIKTIEIDNYKAFHGRYKINVAGKNLFIYGENGSGKSSLYYALKDFFQSSMEYIDLTEVENIFTKDAKKGNCAIRITFNAKTPGTKKRTKNFSFTSTSKDTDSGTDTSIRDANNYCQKKRKKVIFKTRLKDYTTQDFWKVRQPDRDTFSDN